MPRLRQVPRSEVTDEVVLAMYERLFPGRDPVAEPGTATGTPGDWWTVFALVPDVFRHAVSGFSLYRSPDRKLDPVLRELGQTRAGWLRGSQFVFSQHCKALRSLGLTDEAIASIPSWAASEHFTPLQRSVLGYTDALVGDGGRVDDGLFEALRAELSDEEMLELTYVTCLYDMHATMCRALRLEYDDREEPIVEVAAPGEFQGLDLGAMISHPGS